MEAISLLFSTSSNSKHNKK